jgi:hypothetical protein
MKRGDGGARPPLPRGALRTRRLPDRLTHPVGQRRVVAGSRANTKAIIVAADPLAPRITPAFLEYAQARHFHIDPARGLAAQCA